MLFNKLDQEHSLILADRKARCSKSKVERSNVSWGTSLFFFLILGKEAQACTYALNARNAKNLR
jgi:hypothetical protein